jgi:hypothetical protein
MRRASRRERAEAIADALELVRRIAKHGKT